MNWTIQWKGRDCKDEQKARFDYILSAQDAFLRPK